jgi:murein DD-endopeptidase MepM/ murein hydrolase activator NlpD
MVKRNRDISHFSTIAKIMKQADIKKDSGFSEKELWHFHPVYFYKHVNIIRSGQEFNPYLGKENITRGGITVHVVDNPGFAPVYTTGDKKYTCDNIDFYADITGLFGQYYSDYGRFHEGVDFNGTNGTEIKSFMCARVLNFGWTTDPYGIVLILANELGKGIYMLAHLQKVADNIQPGTIIQPNEVVAYVGESGNRIDNYWSTHNSGPHLHVSYYDVQYDIDADRRGEFYKKNGDVISFGSSLGWNNPTEKNPFWHDSGHRDKPNATNIV